MAETAVDGRCAGRSHQTAQKGQKQLMSDADAALFQPTLASAGLSYFGLCLQSAHSCAALSAVVHSYLQVSTAKPTPYPTIPDGSQAIFIGPGGSTVGGAQTQARDMQLPEAGSYFGIRFKPGALAHFFDLDLADITDQYADSRYIPCRRFGGLHEEIYRCSGFRARARICERWLLQHYRPRPTTALDHAMSLVHHSAGNLKISELASAVGWSSRNLNRWFRRHTGLSTKGFAQTVRFQHLFRQLYTAPGDSLDAAHRLGFYDQSHLIKDYKKRLLAEPSSFFSRFTSDFYNH